MCAPTRARARPEPWLSSNAFRSRTHRCAARKAGRLVAILAVQTRGRRAPWSQDEVALAQEVADAPGKLSSELAPSSAARKRGIASSGFDGLGGWAWQWDISTNEMSGSLEG